MEDDNMSNMIDRRKFIKLGAAAAAAIPLSSTLASFGSGKNSPNETIKIGVIGTGDRGEWECYILKQTPGIEVVACCDTIPKHLGNGLK
jgi:hypothetical protein